MSEKQSPWLEYEAQRTGKTVEEVRQIMRERSAKVSPSRRGFANNRELARRAGKIGGKAKKDNGLGTGVQG